MARGDGFLIRAKKSSINSLDKSIGRINSWIAAEDQRHAAETAKLKAMKVEAEKRREEDVKALTELGGTVESKG